MKFKVAIIRTETQSFFVEADDGSEAVDKVSSAWDNGTIELNNPDTSDTDFSLIGRADDNARATL